MGHTVGKTKSSKSQSTGYRAHGEQGIKSAFGSGNLSKFQGGFSTERPLPDKEKGSANGIKSMKLRIERDCFGGAKLRKKSAH